MNKEKRKPLTLLALFVIGMSTFVVANYTQSRTQRTYDIMLQNVEVLTQLEEESEEMIARRESCYNNGGTWNESSHCEASDFEDFTCTVSGEVSLFGVTIKGSYTKGKTYKLAWARYSCVESKMNCCTKQGLYSGNTKLA